MSAGAPVPAALLVALGEVLPAASLHTPYGMTEVLPVTDISLAQILAAGAGEGVCVGRPLAGVDVGVVPHHGEESVGQPVDQPTDDPGVTGEICVRAAHVKDRYDALWMTQRSSTQYAGWHRTGDVGHLDDEGRLWVEGRTAHLVHTADAVVTPVGAEQRVEGIAGVHAAAVVGVGPIGAQVVVVVVVTQGPPTRRRGRRRGSLGLAVAAPDLAQGVRRAAGVPVAAVLVADRLPLDIRHASKVDRAEVARQATRTTATTLLERGDEVTVMQRRPAGIACREVLGDVADPDVVRRAVRGQDVVLHLAAKVDVVGPLADYERANVQGTRAVVEACRSEAVPRLVHVSSPSVAHAGRPLCGAPAAPADPLGARGNYARTKAAAEVIALGADAPGLAVLVVRPHLVWGPGDTQLVARLVTRARAGRLPVLGDGAALIDTTYVADAAAGLVAAADVCGPAAHGEALVLSGGDPRPVVEILERVCRAAGVRAPHRHVPVPLALVAGSVVDAVWSATRRTDTPPLTRFLAEQLSTAHWFDQRRTRAVLGWSPQVGIEAGFTELTRWYDAGCPPIA